MSPKKTTRSEPAHAHPPDRPITHAGPPAAVTIDPTENHLTLSQGDSHDEVITVTIPPRKGERIGNVSLVASGATAPFVVSISPAGGYGPLATDKEQKLTFKVTFRGVEPCGDEERRFDGTLDVVIDGAVVAQKRVDIRVPACPTRYSYSVKFVCGTQAACSCECAPVRPGVYATEINIYNYHGVEVEVEKKVIPIVFAGAASGREPRWSRPRASDRITLPPYAATSDDCCRLSELLLGGPSSSTLPLTIGFLELTARAELAVTAVYTVSDPASEAVSLDVAQIQGRKVGKEARS